MARNSTRKADRKPSPARVTRLHEQPAPVEAAAPAPAPVEAAAPAPAALPPLPSRSIVPVAYRKALAASTPKDAKTANGNRAVDVGDAVALALRGLDLETVRKVAKETLGYDAGAHYTHLNAGQQRMNLGNRIRAHLKNTPGAALKGVPVKH